MSARDPIDHVTDALTDPAFWRDAKPCADMPVARLRRYSVLDVDDDELVEIEAHLAGCDVCRATVDLLDDELLADPALHAPAGPVVDQGPGAPPLPIADVAAPSPPRARQALALGAVFAAAVALALLVPRLTEAPEPWTAELASAEAGPRAAELNILAEHVGKRDRAQAKAFSGRDPDIPRPAFTHGFASAGVLLNASDDKSRAAWQALVDKAEADAAEADAWGRWAALVSFADNPPAEAFTAERRAAFADWAAPQLRGRPTCQRDLEAVRDGEIGAVAYVVECLLTTGDRVSE